MVKHFIICETQHKSTENRILLCPPDKTRKSFRFLLEQAPYPTFLSKKSGLGFSATAMPLDRSRQFQTCQNE